MSEGKTKRRGGWAAPTIIIAGLAILTTFGLAFKIYRAPSGSMQPALYPGDYLVVAKWSYGYGRYSFAPLGGPSPRLFARAPERGDLAVFRPVSEPDRDFIKRVIGLPGDRIQMIAGILYINGEAVDRQNLGEGVFIDAEGFPTAVQVYRETLPNGVSHLVFDREASGQLDNTREFVAPPDHYFVMGDDRDNSADRRVPGVVGFVPFENFIGRVDWVWETSSAVRYQSPPR